MTAEETGGVRRLSFPSPLAAQLRQSPCGIVLTGGGGWIGQAVLEMLESVWGDEIRQRVAVFGSSRRDLALRSGRMVPCRALRDLGASEFGPALFIHCAFLTKDKLLDQSVASFVAANQAIGDRVAEAVERSDVRAMFTLSSGAVYKKGARILDDDLQANAYGVMKLADEKRFTELAARKNIPLCMPRLFNLSGPFINKIELYALSSMIAAALGGGPLTIRAAHRVVRSYIHVADLVALAFAVMLEPATHDRPVFDTAGDEIVEMGELAESVRRALDHPACTIERPALLDGKDDVYVGDGAFMKAMLQRRGMSLRDLPCQIRDTADYMRTSGSGSA